MGGASRTRRVKAAESGATRPPERERCGLCGKRNRPLRRTECCGQLICDNAFSYARSSCPRNHDRFTLCAHHHCERHRGNWKTCRRCRKDFEPEMYVYYGTNKHNFEKLPNLPAYEPTHCAGCGRVIVLSQDGCTLYPDGSYRCDDCFED